MKNTGFFLLLGLTCFKSIVLFNLKTLKIEWHLSFVSCNVFERYDENEYNNNETAANP